MMRILLIRHCETNYSVKHRYCGASDPSLNCLGRKQAKVLRGTLKNIGIDKVYSSSLKRAYETSRLIYPNYPIQKLNDFREIDFGIFEGLKYEEIIERFPKLYKEWIDKPLEIKIPGMESLKGLAKRVERGLFSIQSRHQDETVAIVTHGGPIRVILCKLRGMGLDMFWRAKVLPIGCHKLLVVK